MFIAYSSQPHLKEKIGIVQARNLHRILDKLLGYKNSEAASAAVAAEVEKVCRGVNKQSKVLYCDSFPIAKVSGEEQLMGQLSKPLMGKAQRILSKLS